MGGTIFTFIVGLPFQVYLAHALGPTGLGIVGIAEAVVTITAGFLSFGLAPLAMRFIPEYREHGNSRSIRLLLVIGLVALICVGSLGTVMIRPLATLLPVGSDLEAEAAEVLNVLRFLLPISMISFLLSQSLRGFQEIRVMVLSTSVLSLTIKVVLSLAFFNSMGASPHSYALAIVISQAAPILPMGWALLYLSRSLPHEAEPSAPNWRSWASFAGTNYANGLLSAVGGNADRIIIGLLLGPSAVGVLMVVRQLQQFPTVFHQIVLTVVSPVFARLKAAGDMAGLVHHLHLSNDWVMRMAIGLILVLVILPDHVLTLYGASFSREGTVLMLVVTLAVAVNIGTGPVGMLLNMTGNHVAMLRISLLSSATVLVGYFLLIPLLGLVGAGLSVLMGNALSNGSAIWLVKKRLGISWYDPRFRGWILPSVAAGGLLFAMRPVLASLDTFSAKAIGLAVATLFAYLVFFGINLKTGLHEDDRELFRAVRSRMSRILKTRGSLS